MDQLAKWCIRFCCFWHTEGFTAVDGNFNGNGVEKWGQFGKPFAHQLVIVFWSVKNLERMSESDWGTEEATLEEESRTEHWHLEGCKS